MDAIAQALQSAFRNWPEASRAQAALLAWPLVAGQTIASRTRPLECEDGVLTVEVLDPAWLPQLQGIQRELLAELARFVGPGRVNRLELRTATQAEARPKQPVSARKPGARSRPARGKTL